MNFKYAELKSVFHLVLQYLYRFLDVLFLCPCEKPFL